MVNISFEEPPIVSTLTGNRGNVRAVVVYDNGASRNGETLQYVMRIRGTNNEDLGIDQRFITIDTNDQFPSRTLTVQYDNYDQHQNIEVAIFMWDSNNNAVSTTIIQNISVFSAPVISNKLVNITFTNGENAINAVLTSEDAELVGFKAIGAGHFQIQSSQDTNAAVTETFAAFAQRIDEIGFGTPDPTPDPTGQNISLIIDMHDGHFLAGIVTQTVFDELHNFDQTNWTIIDSTFTDDHETDDLSSMLVKINTHILEDADVIPPDPDPDPTFNNIFVIVGFNNGHVNIEATLTQNDAAQVVFKLQGATVAFLAQFQDVNDPVTETFAAFAQRMDTAAFVTPPTPDPVPNTGMVLLNLGVFELKDDRLTGDIIFVSSTTFNPFFFGKNLITILQISDKNGATLTPKENDLFFFQNEITERIFYDESAFGNTELHLKAFVFLLDDQFNALAFSEVKEFIVKAGEPPIIPPTTGGGGDKLNMFIKAAPLLGIAALFFNSAKIGKKI